MNKLEKIKEGLKAAGIFEALLGIKDGKILNMELAPQELAAVEEMYNFMAKKMDEQLTEDQVDILHAYNTSDAAGAIRKAQASSFMDAYNNMQRIVLESSQAFLEDEKDDQAPSISIGEDGTIVFSDPLATGNKDLN